MWCQFQLSYTVMGSLICRPNNMSSERSLQQSLKHQSFHVFPSLILDVVFAIPCCQQT